MTTEQLDERVEEKLREIIARWDRRREDLNVRPGLKDQFISAEAAGLVAALQPTPALPNQDEGASATADRAVVNGAGQAVSAPWASVPSAGYAEAFYEIAKMLGLDARPEPPAEVWQLLMRPMLATRIGAYEPLVSAVEEAHAALAKLPSNTLGFADDGYGNRWPIHSELLDRMWIALATARGKA